MAGKQLIFDEAARFSLMSGVDELGKVVGLTLGPSGRNVLLSRMWTAPVVCSEGVTIAKELELPDAYENLGAQLVQQAASKTNDVVGDGTTTAVVLAQAIVREGFMNVAAGASGMALKKGIDQAVDAVVEELRKMAIPVESREQINRIAALSAHEEAIASRIADAMDKVGRDGVITVEESKTLTDELELVEGMRLDRGYISPYFVTDPQRMEVVLDDPLLLITDQKVSSSGDIVPAMEMVARMGGALVVIAEDAEAEALAVLVVNKLRGAIKCVAIKAPGFGDRRKALLQDLAVLTDATVITAETGLRLDSIEDSHLGSARRLVASKEESTIIEGRGSEQAIQERVEQIRVQIEETTLRLRPGKAAGASGRPGRGCRRDQGGSGYRTGADRAQGPSGECPLIDPGCCRGGHRGWRRGSPGAVRDCPGGPGEQAGRRGGSGCAVGQTDVERAPGPHCRKCRLCRQGGAELGPPRRGRLGLRRGAWRVWPFSAAGHHRPGQGHPVGAAECR